MKLNLNSKLKLVFITNRILCDKSKEINVKINVLVHVSFLFPYEALTYFDSVTWIFLYVLLLVLQTVTYSDLSVSEFRVMFLVLCLLPHDFSKMSDTIYVTSDQHLACNRVGLYEKLTKEESNNQNFSYK